MFKVKVLEPKDRNETPVMVYSMATYIGREIEVKPTNNYWHSIGEAGNYSWRTEWLEFQDFQGNAKALVCGGVNYPYSPMYLKKYGKTITVTVVNTLDGIEFVDIKSELIFKKEWLNFNV